MSIIGLLLLVGLIIYWVVQRHAAGVTRTPLWLLWLVMVTPAVTWTIVFLYSKALLSVELIVTSLVISSLLYWFLVQMGRIDASVATKVIADKPDERQDERANPIPELKLASEQPTPSPARLLSNDEEATLKACFPWSVYYVQTIDYRLQAVICKGHLRTDPSKAYETIRQNIAEKFGDRFLVVFQEGSDNKPFFALVPNPYLHKGKRSVDSALHRPRLALALLVITLIMTTVAGAAMTGVTVEQLQASPEAWLQGLSYSLPLMIILGIHELAHYLTARAYGLRVTLPYFIPAPFFLGTFGAFIQIRSPMPNRKALFDVSIAGPAAGLVVTIPVLLWGLAHSEPVALPANATIGSLQAFNPAYTLMLALLSKLALGSAVAENVGLKLHPAAIAGCLGLLVTALNLMPVGQLDGGHIVHAMLGQRKAAIIGQVARVLMLLLCLRLPDFGLWALMLFLMPSADEPALNDVTELDDQRDFWGLIAIATLLLIILPPPAALTRLLFQG
ncbi:MAG: site-2 protease family protein [Cyanobacteria bacterium]|nr:site-2 protease family protein [Cyanobacteriota bacterium]MDW8201809.1 site-2 protease family protein [Cyanobacteriota bacterium SKYGB_h_bin112]